MRSKILNQFKYQGSAGTAFDRTGFNSAIFVAIGGTSSTAIKVQHCDTNNGTFTDFATLVSADDAGTLTMGQFPWVEWSDYSHGPHGGRAHFLMKPGLDPFQVTPRSSIPPDPRSHGCCLCQSIWDLGTLLK